MREGRGLRGEREEARNKERGKVVKEGQGGGGEREEGRNEERGKGVREGQGGRDAGRVAVF